MFCINLLTPADAGPRFRAGGEYFGARNQPPLVKVKTKEGRVFGQVTFQAVGDRNPCIHDGVRTTMRCAHEGMRIAQVYVMTNVLQRFRRLRALPNAPGKTLTALRMPYSSGSEHLVSANASATEPASLLAAFVADDGATLTTPDP